MVDEGPADAEYLSSEERQALADWADHEPSDGFADAVVMAWVQEARVGASRAPNRGMVGIGAGLAAAAAVLLFMRIIPPGPNDAMAHASRCEPEILRAEVNPEEAAVAVPESTDRVAVLGDDAVAVLTRHCSPCHDGLDSEAKADALEVFDVRQPRWWSGMSDGQLGEVRLRIEQLGAADGSERQQMDAFIEAQLAERAHAG